MRIMKLALALLLAAGPALAQSTGTLNLVGPSTNSSAPQITSVTQINGPINTALAAKADASGGVLTNPTLAGTVGLGAGANVSALMVPFTATLAGAVPAPGSVLGYCLHDSGGWAACGGSGGAPGGAMGNVQTNNGAGGFGALLPAALTALINPFTTALAGAVPAPGSVLGYCLHDNGTWLACGGSGTFTGGTVTGATTFTAPTVTAGITDSGGINTTFATGYQISGRAVLNLLANQASPVLSPEGNNPPNPLASYSPNALVVGYAETTPTTTGTYDNTTTVNLTTSGTTTQHWGLIENSIHLLGTGALNQELNVQKNYLLTASTVSGNGGENYEAGLDNFGTLIGWSGFTSGMANQNTGTLAFLTAFAAGMTNNNSTAGSVGLYVGFSCNVLNGTKPNTDYCIYNQDPLGSIVNQGHFSARPDVNIPVLTSCGTTPALTSRSSDDAGQITTGAGATTCTLTFHLVYGQPPTVLVLASDGGTAPTYTYSASAITFSAVRAGGVYQYWVLGSG